MFPDDSEILKTITIYGQNIPENNRLSGQVLLSDGFVY
jgi:hypothetical protein